MLRLRESPAAFLDRHPWIVGPALTAGVFICLHVCLFLFHPVMFYGDGWAVVWPVNGIMVALLLLTPRRSWAWLLLGLILFQVFEDLAEAPPISQIFVDIGCDLLETLLVALTLPGYKRLEDWLQEPRLIARFTIIAAVVAPAMSAALAAIYFHVEWQKSFYVTTLRWAISGSLGMVLWVPLVLVLFSRETYDLFRWKSLGSTLGFLGLVGGMSWLIFHQSIYPLAFMMLPLLLLVALRMGFSGSVLAVNILTVIATSATLAGTGQFASIKAGDQTHQVLVLQVYLLLAMLTSFPITLVMLEREGYASQLKVAYQQMELLATHDALTGLSNRRQFDETLTEEWLRAKRHRTPIAVLMADVDYFKPYNDFYGHMAGDRILKAIAEAILSVPQRPSDLVARYGGEEFVILLPLTNSDEALHVAEKIRSKIAALNLSHENSPYRRVTISVGSASLIPGEGLQPSVLVNGSDEALYEAKRNGRNRVELSSFSEQPSARAMK